MKHGVYNLFLISESLNGITKVPIQTFISNNFDTAKLYFHDWLKDKKCKTKFTLYKIGEIQNNFQIKEMKVFITNGSETKEQKLCIQRNLIIEEKQRIAAAAKEKETIEIVKKLFDGKEI